MRVVAVEVEDFGVFSGTHRFQLAASATRPYHATRALIVGHNGSGKSTLFRAISLALYGPASLGARVSRQTYKEHLRSLVHRGVPGSPTAGATAARVAVDLEYVRCGASQNLRLERSWRCCRDALMESASANWLTADGGVADPVAEHLVAELLPSELRRMMLVDVALVDELTRALQSPGALERILRELTGLNLMERLRGDLLTVGSQDKRDAPRQHNTELLQRSSARVNEIDTLLDEARSAVLQAEESVAGIEHAIAEMERELMSVGSGAAADRPALRERLIATEAELELVRGELRDLCNGTLPFALCPSLCLELDASLNQEALSFGAESVMSYADEWIDDLCSEIVADEGFRELVPETQKRRAISEHLRRSAARSLGARIQLPRRALLHDLSERDRIAVRGWIAEAVGVMPGRVATLSLALDRLEATRAKTLEELDRVPDESGLEVVQRGLRDMREQLVNANSEAMRSQDLLASLETERLELLSQTKKLEEQLAGTAAADRVAALIHRTRLALADFEREQLQQRAVEFADALVAIFNGLSRKQTLLAAAAYDPAAGVFCVMDGEGRELDLSQLSTGELQLYSMAVLESLRTTSGRDYPLLVDTPLAYLDEQHRDALMSGVLFGSRSQVVLFATDKEIDSRTLQRWSPDVDHVYRLVFDSTLQSSSTAAVENSRSPSSRTFEGQVA